VESGGRVSAGGEGAGDDVRAEVAGLDLLTHVLIIGFGKDI
jgi:hypothetical protein